MNLPLTVGQHGLWYLCQADARTGAAYNVVLALESDAPVDAALLREAWARLCARHPLLAARVAVVDLEPRFVLDGAPRLDVSEVEGDVRALAREASAAAPDLSRGPLHRVLVVRPAGGTTCAGGHGLVLAISHLVFDGASATVLLRELSQACAALARGREPAWGDAPRGQAARVSAESAYLQGEAGQRQLAVLVERLAGASSLSTPTILGRRTGPAGGVHDAVSRGTTLDPATVAGVRRLAAAAGTTPAAVYLAALEILVWQASGQAAFTLAVPTSLRDEATASDVGYLANLGIARAEVEPSRTVSDQVIAASGRLLDLVDEARIPFPTLVRALKRKGEDASRLQPAIGFNCQPAPAASLVIGEATLRGVAAATRFAKDRLAIDVDEGDQATTLTVLACGRTFDEPSIGFLLDQVLSLLEQMSDEPGRRLGDLDTMPPAYRERLVSAWRSPSPADGSPGPDADASGGEGVLDLFDAQVRAAPDAPAVACPSTSWTYAELGRRAAQLAHALREAGVRPESRVACCLPRGAWQVLALLGTLQAGGVHVPLDLDQPDARLAGMLADVAPAVLLVRGALPASRAGVTIPDRCTLIDLDDPALSRGVAGAPGREARPANLAYAIHTSGSTGRPKAVGVTAGALDRHVRACIAHYGITAADRVLQFAASHLDPAIEQCLVALCAGASLVLRGEEVWSPRELVEALRRERITVADVPSAYWRLYAADGFDGLRDVPLRLLVIGGEAAPAGTLPVTPLPFAWINAYGPTESTITATSWRGGRREDVTGPYLPIGRPLSHTRAYVLDERLRPVPPGVRGELWLAGPQLARGYLGRPALTAASFVPDPFGPPGSRMYRTGDVASHREDGILDFHGRTDHQVKIRGLRVEIGEVESAIHALEGVRAAVVAARDDEATRATLLAAWVVAPGQAESSLRDRLAQRLPSHMVPARWMMLDALPVGAHGKVDRRSLPEPLATGSGPDAFVAPDSDVARTIAAVWCEVLRVPRVGLHDNFFALGGHSLLATQIIGRLGERLGRAVSLRQLLDAPTVGGLALRLSQEPAPAPVARPKLVRQARATPSTP